MTNPIPSRRILAAVLVGTLMVPALVFGAPSSKSRSSGGSDQNSGVGRNSATATMVMRCTLTKVDPQGVIHLVPESGAAEEVIAKIPTDIRIRAQDKNQFDGRKKLAFSDLKAGQRLRITVLPSQERIVSLVVLKQKKST